MFVNTASLVVHHQLAYVALTSTMVFFDRYRILALVSGIIAASVFNFAMATFVVYSNTRD
ncbi:MAG: hypothetical protein U5O39_19220 [Gammaproteobacteria bacterium]|nr:hypothetical protein [Gammaproteobacteria bacterium]